MISLYREYGLDASGQYLGEYFRYALNFLPLLSLCLLQM